MSETSKDYLSQYTGEQVEARLARCNLVPTLDHVPTAEDLSFVDTEGTHTFLVGDECRYLDVENGQYLFYKLHDITDEGDAVWLESAGGGNQGEVVTFQIQTNQGLLDAAFQQLWIEVWYENQKSSVLFQSVPVEMPLPAGKQCTVKPPEVEGYRTPEEQMFETVAGAERVVYLAYSAERVMVSFTASDGTDASEQTLTVKAGEETLLEKKIGTGQTFLVPTGTEYTLAGSLMNGHKSPVQTFTASQTTREVVLTYQLITQTLLIFDTAVHLPANITVQNSADLETLLSQTRRCLAKKTADGMAICYLNDANFTQYEGGEGAALDGSEGDVMVCLPDVYYRHERLDDTHFRYGILGEAVDDTYHCFPASLLGAYKGYVEGGKLYSVAGKTPTASLTYDELKMAATARGEGFQLIDFAQHCQLAMLLYAKYKTRDLQAVLGSGAASFDTGNTTGMRDAFGLTDTTPETATGYVSALGVEGIFGCLSEYLEGIFYLDRTWHLTDPDGTERTVEAASSPTGWISRMALEEGPFFDLIPTQTGASGSTMYADLTQVVESLLPLCAARSYFSSGSVKYADDGIAYLDALNVSYLPSPFYGSRLAYRGNIQVVESVAAFKQIPIHN